MKTRRSTKLFATVAAASLVLAACGGDDDDAGDDDTTEADDTADGSADEPTDDGDEPTDDGDEPTDDGDEPTGDGDEPTDDGDEPTDDGDEPAGQAVAYGNAQEFSNYNNGLASSNSVKNTIVLTQVLPAPFNFAGPGGELQMDEEFVDAVNVVSDDPQVIEYVINADAVWSDGDPIDCNDFYFGWASSNGTYKQLDDEGNPVVDEESGSELGLFEVAGTGGYEDIESVECSDDGKTVTTSYSAIYSDWRALFAGLLPAHIIEAAAGAEPGGSVEAFQSDNLEAITAMAEFHNNGWSLNPGELKPEIMPSGGKLIIDSWEAGASLTLVPNENYWGTMANGPVTIRYIAEEAQAQALANGEINAMDPQPTPDLLAQLQGTDGVVVETGNQYVWEHFDFNFNTAFGNRDVREAFAKCLPRQQMVSNLIQPLVPDAQILNNRTIQEFEAAYVDNSGGQFDEVDIEGAAALLAGSGEALPIDVRVGWFDNGGNQRRTDQVALTVESCNQVEGFNVIDAGSETFFDVELSAGDWDVAMFAWAGSPLKSGQDAIYGCEGGINFTGYCSEEVDAVAAAINAELDADAQLELSNELDVLIWEDLVTIPVFSFPGVAAWSENAENIVYNPSNNGLMWNAASWQLS
ncbi:MAG: ABC transporter substrate-binding protein [Ilumatobacteraceae bacterium]|nr:ABC transporter substrate-binding protein [Ilumatobacteraceae bacterium]